MPAAQQVGERCAECHGALEQGQRYCLACGARTGAREELLRDLLRRLDAGADPDACAPSPAQAAAPAPAQPPAIAPTLSRSSLATWGAMTLAFLGFGIVLGDAASSNVQSTLASSRQPLEVVVPSSAPPGEGSSQSGSSAAGLASSAGAGEASSGEREAASTPAASKPAVASAKSSAGSPSRSGSSGEESASQQPSSVTPATKLPALKHVFLITLSDQPYAAVFGPASAAPYLARTLEKRGELLVRYYAVAHEQLANEIALLSGQGPTTATAANCPTYADVGAGQADGGCVYPRSTETLAGQLSARHLAWRAYVQGQGEGGRGACAHPAPGEADPSASRPGPYATFRNPFAYFHSVLDGSACRSEDVGLDKLAGDLARSSRTPSFSYIVPDRCHDGSPVPCAPGAASGLAAADGFLKQIVPKILASKAYKQSGLLVITVDEAPSSGEFADSSSCCGQPKFPALPGSGGGGQVGALLLSPRLKASGTTQEPYNHFSLLRTFEDMFGVTHLGYAAAARVNALEPSLFSAK